MMEIRRTVMSHPSEGEEGEPQPVGEVVVTDDRIELRWGWLAPSTVLYSAPLELWAWQQVLWSPQGGYIPVDLVAQIHPPEAGEMSTSDGLGA